MLLHIIFCGVVIAFDCIAIDAPVEATFIRTDVDAFDAVADTPLILVFLGKNRAADNSFYQFFVDTQATGDIQMSQIHFSGAGI